MIASLSFLRFFIENFSGRQYPLKRARERGAVRGGLPEGRRVMWKRIAGNGSFFGYKIFKTGLHFYIDIVENLRYVIRVIRVDYASFYF